ncbi:hypothetical protein F8388_009654 [Cannabis sativa]|uniref:Phospho-2-dehydro-3-deoxyheptonate aldolase n=1 Tax=Cannabis sativa TaxID=3483 RepID=A0A7J6HBP6_CANSA|nr:hypothetical protein F8388_009654 [Cannabis sativa]KAF4392351.1 hypothetical protein G4B88_005310 [Cannabis sativa]
MALASTTPVTKSLLNNQNTKPLSPKFNLNLHSHLPRLPNRRKPISAVHAAEPSNPSKSTSQKASNPSKSWSIDIWKTKKAIQLPEYPNQAELDSVLKTLESFPPIVFAREARSLEEKLGQAAMGKAFLLQGGDCAESFKEFNANNIRDTFRVCFRWALCLCSEAKCPLGDSGIWVWGIR